MLSFTFRRVLSHPGVFSIARRLPTRAISFNQSFAMTVPLQRNLTTTAGDRNSDSTADPKPEPESKPKSTRRKTGSSRKTSGKDKKKKKKKKAVTKPKPKPKPKPKLKAKPKPKPKPKVTVNKETKPPKRPGTGYTLWMRDWISTQPKSGTIEEAQNAVKEGSQIWNTVSENDKQVFREKAQALRDEYYKRLEEWREKVDPAALRELNRRRVARGHRRIRGLRRPTTGYIRFVMRVRNEFPRAEEEDHRTFFKAVAARASSQWQAMNDAEKAEYNDQAKSDLDTWREKYRVESKAKA